MMKHINSNTSTQVTKNNFQSHGPSENIRQSSKKHRSASHGNHLQPDSIHNQNQPVRAHQYQANIGIGVSPGSNQGAGLNYYGAPALDFWG